MSVISLSPADLTIAASLVIVIALLQWRMRLGNTKSLLIAATRTVLQLLLLGMVLKVVFAASNLYWIALLSAIMLVAAGREVMVRQKKRFVGSWGFLLSLDVAQPRGRIDPLGSKWAVGHPTERLGLHDHALLAEQLPELLSGVLGPTSAFGQLLGLTLGLFSGLVHPPCMEHLLADSFVLKLGHPLFGLP